MVASRLLAAMLASLLLIADVAAFATRSAGGTDLLAYGPSAGETSADIRDIWTRHVNDVCAPDNQNRPVACASAALTSKYSVGEVSAACLDGGSKAPLCSAPAWRGGACRHRRMVQLRQLR
jgi:hypothetical protein